MKIFIDTSAFIALFIKQEKYHRNIFSKYQILKQRKYLLITSDYVLVELFTRLSYDFGENITKKIISVIKKAVENEQLRVLFIDEVLFNKSAEILIKFAEHKISFTDASIYTCVKEFEINEVFTLDSDFKRIGLKTNIL